MKRVAAILLALAVVLGCASALGDERYGAFEPKITKTFSNGQPDEYRFWTNDGTQMALLTVLLAEDMKREDYPAYNACFPIANFSIVLYNTGGSSDPVIKVWYVCSDGYLAIEYDTDMDTAFYIIDDTVPDYEGFPSYVEKQSGEWFNASWMNYYNFDFYDAVPAFTMAMQTWNSYLDHHPELNEGLQIGW